MPKKFIGVVIIIVLLGALVPVLWPMMTGTDTDVQGLTGTDTATVFLKDLWPIILLVIGIGLIAGLIFWSLRKFGVLK